MPQVTWWRDNHLIDSSFEKTFSKTVQNTLSVPQVTREDLGATLTCQASNNNISAPASTRATVDLKCKINLVLVCHSVCLLAVKLRAVNGSTIQFWTLLAKGHSTYITIKVPHYKASQNPWLQLIAH